jgi:UDP-glucose 4-epimerase
MILVTGGAGFIGTNLCKRLVELGKDVISMDDYSSGKIDNHIEGVQYISADCMYIDQLPEVPEIVYHLGEYSKIAPSFNDTDKIIETNMYSTAKVIEYCRKNNVKIVYAGSSSKFASNGANESPYAFSKAQNTEMIKNYSKWFGMKYAICYFYNNYGPYHDTCDNGWETVISIFEKQKKNGEPLTIVKPGTQRRNFTYVGDTIDGLILAAARNDNDEYQLSSNESFNMFELAELFDHNYKLIPERLGDRNSSSTDYEETYKKLKWMPSYKLKKWITRYED